MPKLPRPHVTFEVRCRVALRQLDTTPERIERILLLSDQHSGGGGLASLLGRLLVRLAEKLGCAVKGLQLDHDPALENRRKVYAGGVHVGYRPDANDPDCLRYRDKHAHHIKTNVRGDHGQFPDNTLAKRERRRLKKLRNTREKKAAIRHKRNWPKRKLQSRNTFRSRP